MARDITLYSVKPFKPKIKANQEITVYTVGSKHYDIEPTPDKIILRDSNGRAKVVEGIEDDDIVNVLQLREYVADKITSLYKNAGSIYFTDLSSYLTNDYLNHVFTILDDFVTTDEFIDGSDIDVLAGSTVAIIERDGRLWFDLLGTAYGHVDLKTDQTIGGYKIFEKSVEIEPSDDTEAISFNLHPINGYGTMYGQTGLIIKGYENGGLTGEIYSLQYPMKGGTFALISDVPTNLQNGEGTDSLVQKYSGEVDDTHYGNTSTGESAVVFGEANNNSANRALLAGKLNENSGANSVVAGLRNKNTGVQSIVGGENNTNNGRYNSVAGRAHTVDAPNSTVGGVANTLTDSAGENIVGGNANTVTHRFSSTVGTKNTNNSYCGIVGGSENEANGDAQLMTGVGNISHSNGTGRITGGVWNNPKKGTLLELGNGTRDSERSNAFEVYRDGRAKVYGAPTEDEDVVRLKDLEKSITISKFELYSADKDNLTTYEKGEIVCYNEDDGSIIYFFKAEVDGTTNEAIPYGNDNWSQVQLAEVAYTRNAGYAYIAECDNDGNKIDDTYAKIGDIEDATIFIPFADHATEAEHAFTAGYADQAGFDINDNYIVDTYATKEEVAEGYVAKKITTANELILTIKKDGSTDTLGFSVEAQSHAMVRRDANSVFKVGTPTEEAHVTNKEYVDEAVANAGGKLYRHTITASVLNDIYNKVSWGNAIISFLSSQDTIHTLGELQHRLIGAFVSVTGSHNSDYLMCTFTGTVYEFLDPDVDNIVSIMGAYYHSGGGFEQSILAILGTALSEGQYTIEQI